MLLESRIPQEIIENQDSPWVNAGTQAAENGLCRAVQVAIDVQKGDRLALAGEEPRQRVLKPSLVKLYVRSYRRQASIGTVGARRFSWFPSLG